ncbi:DUF2971 domain-containing protein [Paenibacillus amylolyticus]|uniref:DUF2971 domain-containing protein n=1 Tax=Paenibacillus amylolyticus TaxID=1451 RepID=UPI00096F34F9|nr:DUF2971 domain-containing protein [Paenibacillus amylolyticus]OMF45398.1 hypothetical protein BK136_09865 [Paenibacillus amylolyticus]
MWIDEFTRLMFPTNVNEMNLEEAMKLKLQNIPSALFKYRGFNKFALDNLLNDTTWLSSASNQNDPYDCALQLDTTSYLQERTIQEVLSLLPEYGFGTPPNSEKKSFEDIVTGILEINKPGDKQNPEGNSTFVSFLKEVIQQQNEKSIERFRGISQDGMLISCFSEVNNSILMWSHYAVNHTGFCIEYDFIKPQREKLITNILCPVIYQDTLFDSTQYFIEALNNGENYNNLSGIYMAMIKSMEWKYEKEWRLILPMGTSSGFNRPLFRPEAVYLGAKISDEHKQEIMKIAKHKEIAVFQMKMMNREFKLVPEQIL